ncbi:MAG TPA: DUF2177 family protein [Rhizomicrobium sp.]
MVLLAYFSALVVLVVVDALWLAFYARVLFKPALGDIARETPRWIPAIFFYLLYPAGIVFFAVLPALDTASLLTVLGRGALFGFFVYMTYDLTNLASIKAWTVPLALLDIIWGTFLTALVAAASMEAVLLLH